MFVNMRATVKKPSVTRNFALGSSLCTGLLILVNLNPSTNLNDNFQDHFFMVCAALIAPLNLVVMNSLAAYASMMSCGKSNSFSSLIRTEI